MQEGGAGVSCSFLALAVPGSISSLSRRTGSEGGGRESGGGQIEVRVEGGWGEGEGVEGHRAVEVIFFIPLRWASVEQPTGSRTVATFLFRAE